MVPRLYSGCAGRFEWFLRLPHRAAGAAIPGTSAYEKNGRGRLGLLRRHGKGGGSIQADPGIQETGARFCRAVAVSGATKHVRSGFPARTAMVLARRFFQ